MNTRLRYLAETYFHQDYDLDYADANAVVVGFAEEEAAAAVRELVSDIDFLLAAMTTESRFEDLWCQKWLASYDPTEDGWTYREWFAHVRELLLTSRGASETEEA